MLDQRGIDIGVVPLVGTWIETRNFNALKTVVQVVPLVGTWIETEWTLALAGRPLSFPSWERGLKRHVHRLSEQSGAVVPLVGTWIETRKRICFGVVSPVVPLVGTWIETLLLSVISFIRLSFPSWERGLKHHLLIVIFRHISRSPRGNVD